MNKLTTIFAVGIVCFVIGAFAGFSYVSANPPISSPTWPTEEDATRALEGYLSMDVFGAPEGDFSVSQTDSGAWVVLRK